MIIVGQLLIGVESHEFEIFNYFEDDEYILRPIDVQMVSDGNIVQTICYMYREEYIEQKLLNKKWRFDDFTLPTVLDPYVKMCGDCRREFELTWKEPQVFDEEEVRDAMRKIQYKKETNKNYVTGFTDRTPTTVNADDF